MQNSDLELYKLGLTLWDSETTRFYSRQNLYIGIQIAGFAGMMAGFEGLVKHPDVLRIGFSFLLLVGLITASIATRGLTTQILSMKVIAEIERRNPSLDLLKLTKRHASAYLLLNFVLAVALAWLVFFMWVVAWVFLEATSLG